MNQTSYQFNQKAEKLYRGKVLIDRARTRDIMAEKIQASRLVRQKKVSVDT